MRYSARGYTLLLLVSLAALGVLVLSESQGARAAAIGTSWTYQGTIYVSGSGYTGQCDLRFALWDAAVGGSQIGSTDEHLAVSLDAGLFSVSLDFGAVFDGAELYVAREFRCPAGGGAYTDAGRHVLAPTPLALWSRQALTATTAITTTAIQSATWRVGPYTLTVPATGITALGTGAASRMAYWTGTNTIAAGSAAVTHAGNMTVSGSVTGTLQLDTRNTNTSTTATAIVSARNDTADQSSLFAYASGYSGTIYGINRARLSEVRLDGATGGMIDTAGNTPLYLATGSTSGSPTVMLSGGNVLIGVTAAGTSAAKVLGIGNATAPSSSPAGMTQLYAGDVFSSTDSGIKIRTETGAIYQFGGLTMTVPADLYVVGTTSAQAYVDRTPWYTGTTRVLDAIRPITGTAAGLDHTSLPAFVRRRLLLRTPIFTPQTITSTVTDTVTLEDGSTVISPTVVTTTVDAITGYITRTEEGRDLGAMLTLLTLGVQELERQSIQMVPPPLHNDSPCERGQIAVGLQYLYACIARDTWRRIAYTAGSW